MSKKMALEVLQQARDRAVTIDELAAVVRLAMDVEKEYPDEEGLRLELDAKDVAFTGLCIVLEVGLVPGPFRKRLGELFTEKLTKVCSTRLVYPTDELVAQVNALVKKALF